MIRGMAHHALEHVHNASVGRLMQGREHGFGFAHAAMLQDGRQSGYPIPDRFVCTEAPNPREVMGRDPEPVVMK
jgi:hypothetical protein